MNTLFRSLIIGCFLSAASIALADAQMPVSEVTVFKDGHAMILRRGEVRTNDEGHVSLTSLPRPVMGTYWPFTDDVNASLKSVSIGTRKSDTLQPARTYADFLRVNAGKEIKLVWNEDRVQGRIVDVPGGELLLLESENTYRLLPVSGIRDLQFESEPITQLAATREEQTLEMQLEWEDAPRDAATVGMMYLQKGIRWIPSYKIELGVDGIAVVKLQATLINELIDLENASVQLVVGVPSFKFKETLDPIAGTSANADTSSELSAYFAHGSQSAHAMSNAMMTQVARMSDFRGTPVGIQAANPNDATPDLVTGNPGEMHVFKLDDVSLQRGHRQVRTISQWEIPFEEVHKLEIDSLPPAEFQQYHNGRNNSEFSSLMNSPKVSRFVRLTNTTDAPLTTAPVLLLDQRKQLVMAQSMMTYAAIGSQVDLEVTTAVDIQVSHDDRETGRRSNALVHNGNKFAQVDLNSTVTLANYRSEPLRVEIERRVFGGVEGTSADGEVTTPLFHEQMRNRPRWYGVYNWPYWWSHLNAVRTIRWTVEIPPGESETVSVDWYYYWR